MSQTHFSKILFLILLFILSLFFTPIGERVHTLYFDISTGQQPVITKSQINQTLAQFKTIPFEALPADYLYETESDQDVFQKSLSGKTYLILQGADMYRYIVGGFRFQEFMPKDDYKRATLNGFIKKKKLYLLIDKELLYKTLELLRALYDEGYDETQLFVNAGFRYPRYNAAIGGASKSRHIQGQAVDMNVGDINMDGRTNQTDKSIVLDILEKKVIKNKGGIGRYPGTMAIHFDVRGYRARWDSH